MAVTPEELQVRSRTLPHHLRMQRVRRVPFPRLSRIYFHSFSFVDVIRQERDEKSGKSRNNGTARELTIELGHLCRAKGFNMNFYMKFHEHEKRIGCELHNDRYNKYVQKNRCKKHAS